jgi:hypothetical protein
MTVNDLVETVLSDEIGSEHHTQEALPLKAS